MSLLSAAIAELLDNAVDEVCERVFSLKFLHREQFVESSCISVSNNDLNTNPLIAKLEEGNLWFVLLVISISETAKF